MLKPITSGKMSCRSIPQNTYSQVLMPLLETGQQEEAARMARKGARMLNGPGYLTEYGKFLAYYAATDLYKAAACLEKTALYARDNKVDWDRFIYLIGVSAFFAVWNDKKRRKKLNVHNFFTSEWVAAESIRLAKAFDEGNGNGHCAELLENTVNQIKKWSAI